MILRTLLTGLQQHSQNVQQVAKTTGDVGAVAVAGATLIQWLPPIAALASIMWIALQILMNWEKIKASWAALTKRRK